MWAPAGGRGEGRRPPAGGAGQPAVVGSKCSLSACSGFSLSPETIYNHICYFAI